MTPTNLIQCELFCREECANNQIMFQIYSFYL